MALDTFEIHFRFETVFRHILTRKWHNLDTIWTVEIWISSTYLIRILFILQLSNNYFKTHFRHNLEKSHTTKRQEYQRLSIHGWAKGANYISHATLAQQKKVLRGLFSTWCPAANFFVVKLRQLGGAIEKPLSKHQEPLYQTAVLNPPFYRLLQLRVRFWLIQV